MHNPTCSGDPRDCTCCIASSYSGSLLRKCIRITIRIREIFVLLCNERGKEDKQTPVLRTKEWENAARTPPYVCFSGNTWKVKLGKEQEEKLCRTPDEMGKRRKRRRWGGGGRARRSMSYYAGNISAEIATVLRQMLSFVCVKNWSCNFALFVIRLAIQSSWHATLTKHTMMQDPALDLLLSTQ